MLIVNVAQLSHRSANGFDVIPVVLFALCANGFAERGEGCENRIPLLRGAGLPDFRPTSKNRLAGEFEFVFGGG